MRRGGLERERQLAIRLVEATPGDPVFVVHGAMVEGQLTPISLIEPDIDTYAESDSVERIVDDVLTRLLDEWNAWWDHKLRAFLVQLEECAKGE